jgi:hypothetical protein
MLAFQTPDEGGRLKMSDGKNVVFYTLFPIYKEELDLYNDKGIVQLLRRFEEYFIDERLDITRDNVVTD